ncbi:MAG: hypothetical protein AB7U46_08310, partial [Paenirhodobacter sp.]|uniref:hypothetical protein n=1 Tax=Paenirhodobacter sp. TaxID=1965326 RepID=UPI003D0BFF4A
DAMAAMGIPRFHISVQIQGVADFSTPKAIYVAEVYFVHEEIGALGTIDAGDDWKFFTVLAGLYGGPDHTGQERRGRDLEAIARENPQSYVFAPVTGLICDLIGNPDGTLVHYDDLSLLRLGLRLSDAVRAQFLGVSQISDRRVDEMMVPATGPWGERMGHRTYEVLTVTDATYEPTIRGADLRYRGETVRFSGACTCNLDGGATATWSDGGAGFEFYQLSDTDSVLIKCYQDADNNHPVELVGAPSGVVGSVGLTISGQGRGRVFYQYNRWVIDWTPRRGPARGIRSLPGDASFTLSYLDGSYVLLDGTLTANRNCLLSSSGAVAGDIMSLRCGAGVGTYSWDIYDATVTTNLITLDSSTGLAEFVFDGAAWVPWRRGI